MVENEYPAKGGGSMNKIEGKTGEIEIEQQDGDWYIADSPTDGGIRCIIQDNELIDETSNRQRITATVSSFKQGLGENDSYFFLTSPEQESSSTYDHLKNEFSERTASNKRIFPDELISEFKQSRTKSVFYDEAWLREWKKGTEISTPGTKTNRHRFYLRNSRGGTQDNDTQYWWSKKGVAELSPINFPNRETKGITAKRSIIGLPATRGYGRSATRVLPSGEVVSGLGFGLYFDDWVGFTVATPWWSLDIGMHCLARVTGEKPKS